jgi:hypothetical protein
MTTRSTKPIYRPADAGNDELDKRYFDLADTEMTDDEIQEFNAICAEREIREGGPSLLDVPEFAG